MIKHKPHLDLGLTLIEALIFCALLSMLITSSISYLYDIHISNAKLLDEVHKAEGGFVATTAIVLLAIGSLFFLAVTMSAVSLYADGIDHREMRIQRRLNQDACAETRLLIMAKDHFFKNPIELRDLGCIVTR